MTKYYSYRAKTEERKNTKSAFLFIFLTVAAILAVIFLGIPILTQFASFLTNIHKSGQSVDINDKIPPPPPYLSTLPEAVNNLKLEIKGTSEPGATIKIFLNGSNSIYATATDQAGNESQKTAILKVVFDNNPPDINISKPVDGSQFFGSKQKNLSIQGSTKTGSSLTINDRFVLVQDDGSFVYNTQLSDGENSFTIKAIDKAGNSSEKTLKVSFSQ
jgi:hypothetical protein